MPLEVFEIETYSVGHGHSATGSITHITADGRGEVSGKRTWAQLLFLPSSSTRLSGTVDNVGVSSANIQISRTSRTKISLGCMTRTVMS